MGQRFSFVGGEVGGWQVTHMAGVTGDSLPSVSAVDVVSGDASADGAAWVLRGVTSYERYTTRAEHEQLVAIQPALNRPEATCAALIPMKKSAAWWALSQDERRHIFEDGSHHIYAGLQHLPAVARRLCHAYDLGEPFDFVAWLEYPPDHADAFEQLLCDMRATEEWNYVEREIDIRLTRR